MRGWKDIFHANGKQKKAPLLIGNPEKAMSMGWKPMISVEDSLTDLFNEMVLRRRTELKMGMGQDLRL